MKVQKRTGQLVDFQPQKIQDAIAKAMKSTQESNNIEIDSLLVCNEVCKNIVTDHISIEAIQDRVERELMKREFYDTAKAYIIYRVKRAEQRKYVTDQSNVELFRESSSYFNNETIREFVYMRTYSRWIPDKGRREVWSESVQRYMDFMRENLGDKLSNSDYFEVHQAILKNEVMPSMRLLQFAGPAARRCNVCVYNCSFTAPESFKDLADIMYLSMSGTGVGFSVEQVHVEKFPMVASKSSTESEVLEFTIEDSKEGWADAFLFGLHAWYAGDDVKFDYSKLRPAGARLKTMGGRSSGPQPLKELMTFTRETISRKKGRKLSTLDIHDIICKIGQIVVAGGVRRSALISLSDFNDSELRDCKKGAFWNTAPHRCMANNSAVYTEKPTQIEFMKEWLALAESGTGERGIFNRGSLNSTLPPRRIHVLGETTHKLGSNPCGEVLLQPKQFCNLSEIICRPDDTLESLYRKIRIATIIGTYQATLTDYKYIAPQWKERQEQERLLGVSLTGQWDCRRVRVPEHLEKLRKHAISINEHYSEKFGINHSTAITCCKPSGTVSQVTNTASGIHPRFAPYYIRRIRISATDPLLTLMKDQGYPVAPEVGQSEDNATTYVLDFPVKSPQGAICVKDVSAIDQLEYWKVVKINYTEHNPSVTIYVKPDEWLLVGKWVWDNWEIVGGLSFLPYSDHVYQLAPYEEISETEYENLSKKVTKVDFSKLIYYEKEDATDVKREVACAGGACEL